MRIHSRVGFLFLFVVCLAAWRAPGCSGQGTAGATTQGQSKLGPGDLLEGHSTRYENGVALEWQSFMALHFTGYNIYRSETSTPFVQLNKNPVSDPNIHNHAGFYLHRFCDGSADNSKDYVYKVEGLLNFPPGKRIDIQIKVPAHQQLQPSPDCWTRESGSN